VLHYQKKKLDNIINCDQKLYSDMFFLSIKPEAHELFPLLTKNSTNMFTKIASLKDTLRYISTLEVIILCKAHLMKHV